MLECVYASACLSVCHTMHSQCVHVYIASTVTFRFQLLLRVVAILLTASAFNVYVLIPAAILVVVFLALRWYYLKTSRDVKRLEAIGNASLTTCYSYIH